MTLPEPSQMPLTGRLAIEPRHDRFLDVARPAVALERLEDMRRCALADPVLGDRRADTRERRLGLARAGLVHRARNPHHEGGCGLGFERQVGDDVAHQRLLDEALLECRAVPGVVQRLHQALAHHARRTRCAIDAVALHHVDDRAHAAAFRADHCAPRIVELHLGRRVRAIAELVLEALDREVVARPRPGASVAPESRRGPGRCRRASETHLTSAPNRRTCGR